MPALRPEDVAEVIAFAAAGPRPVILSRPVVLPTRRTW
jgi:NADP-dependent 3-hydroxy acid dehydrogenase YdfG